MVLLDDVNSLIKQNVGDLSRLEHIKSTLQNNKELYLSDRKYVDNLIKTHLLPSDQKNEKQNLPSDNDIEDVIKTQETFCGKCGAIISSDNNFCTKCGSSVLSIASKKEDHESNKPKKKGRSKKKKLGIGFGIFLLLIFALGVIGSVDNNVTENNLKNPKLSYDEIKAQALDGISPKDLYDDNKKYAGKIVHYEGEIIQLFHQYGDVYHLNIIKLKDVERNSNYGIFLTYSSEEEPVPFTNIEFYGTVKDTHKGKNPLTGATKYVVLVDSLWLNVTDTTPNFFD